MPPFDAPFVPFNRVALIGCGLIGASIALDVRAKGLAHTIVVGDRNPEHRNEALELGLCDEAFESNGEAVRGADLVILATPVGVMGAAAESLAADLAPGCLVTDVGSVKEAVIRDVAPHIPPHATFIPGHPIAGTEHSGPKAGLQGLFVNRWWILTPLPHTPPEAVARLQGLIERLGAKIAVMEDPANHDRTLAITSHLPQLIAYTIVATADTLAEDMKQAVIRYSASGFHDFTRIAASDPVMWRDIFLNNREAVLDMLQRFIEDLMGLQKSIRRGEGERLEELFTRSRAIRRGIVKAGQAEPLAEPTTAHLRLSQQPPGLVNPTKK